MIVYTLSIVIFIGAVFLTQFTSQIEICTLTEADIIGQEYPKSQTKQIYVSRVKIFNEDWKWGQLTDLAGNLCFIFKKQPYYGVKLKFFLNYNYKV